MVRHGLKCCQTHKGQRLQGTWLAAVRTATQPWALYCVHAHPLSFLTLVTVAKAEWDEEFPGSLPGQPGLLTLNTTFRLGVSCPFPHHPALFIGKSLNRPANRSQRCGPRSPSLGMCPPSALRLPLGERRKRQMIPAIEQAAHSLLLPSAPPRPGLANTHPRAIRALSNELSHRQVGAACHLPLFQTTPTSSLIAGHHQVTKGVCVTKPGIGKSIACDYLAI